MVLQRNATIKIWGWASNGEKVSVDFNGKRKTTVATSDGNWEVEFPKMKAGGPYSMNITGKNTIELNQLLIGDVWYAQVNPIWCINPIEAWISELGFQEFPEILKIIEKNKDTVYVNGRNSTTSSQENESPKAITDKVLIGPTKWFEVDFESKDWRNINIPGYWEDQGIKDLNGVVWYRKEIEIPASMVGKKGKGVFGKNRRCR